MGADKKIQFYDGKSGEPTDSIPNAHAGSIYSVSWSADSKYIVTSSADKTLKVWSVATKAAERTITFREKPEIRDMVVGAVWTTAGDIVAVKLDGSIHVISDWASGSQQMRTLIAHQVGITCLALSDGGSSLLSAAFDGTLACRDLNTGMATSISGLDARSVNGAAHKGKIVGLAACDSNRALSVGWDDKLVTIVPKEPVISAAKDLGAQPVALACAGAVTFVATTQGLLAYSSADQALVVTQLLDFTPTAAVGIGEAALGLLVVVGGNDNAAHVFSLQSSVLTEASSLSCSSEVSALAFSSGTLAVGERGRQINVYKMQDGGATWQKIVTNWVFHTSCITALAISPSGNRIASSSVDQTIKVWTPLSKKKTSVGYAHTNGATSLIWKDEDGLISGGADCIVQWVFPVSDVADIKL